MAKANVRVTKLRTTNTTTAKLESQEIRVVEINTSVLFVGNLWEVESMDKQTANTRSKLKQISSIEEFENILNGAMLSDEEKQLLELHYKEQKPLIYIADELGMSEATVKRKHRKLLMKLGRVF